MRIDKLLLKDTDGFVSVTYTAYVIGTFISLVKFTFADFGMFGITVVHMDGLDCAAVIAALGAVYWGRKNTKTINTGGKDNA